VKKALRRLSQKTKDVPEIPRSQRYANRPALERIFSEKIIAKKEKRNRAVITAVEKYGYRQREIADI
jgi:hypothetical protein